MFRHGYGCVFWKLRLVSFPLWPKVKSCGNGKMVNEYRFRALVVSNHGPAHRPFGILVKCFINLRQW